MKDVPWSKAVYKKYSDKWVAIDDKTGKIAGAGSTITLAYSRAQKMGIKDPVLTKVPKHPGFYVLVAI